MALRLLLILGVSVAFGIGLGAGLPAPAFLRPIRLRQENPNHGPPQADVWIQRREGLFISFLPSPIYFLPSSDDVT